VEPPPPPPPKDPEEARVAAALAPPSEPKGDPSKRLEVPLQTRIEFVFDPSIYDAATNTVELPMRLKNTSNFSIYGPITLEIVGLGSGFDDTTPEHPPQVLNADNGQAGVGARFSFDKALGGDGELKPGMLSGAVPLRFKLIDAGPLESQDLRFKITGRVDAPGT
jgi:hypothetical protein